MTCEGSPEAAEKAAHLLKAFRDKGLPVVHIQHFNPPGAPFFVPGTSGVEIHPTVKPIKGEKVLIKHYPSSFRDTGLLELLKELNVTKLVIAGSMTHMCIDTTTRAAFDLGFQNTVAYDACATRELSFGGVIVPAKHVHASYLAALSLIFAKVISTEEVLKDLA